MVSKATLLFAVLLATVYVAKCAPAEAPKEEPKPVQEEPKKAPGSEVRALPEHKERSFFATVQESVGNAISNAKELFQSTIDMFTNPESQ